MAYLFIFIILVSILLILHSIKQDEHYITQALIPALNANKKILNYNIYGAFDKNEILMHFSKYQNKDFLKYYGNFWLQIDFDTFLIELSNAKIFYETEIQCGADATVSRINQTVLFHGQIIKIADGILDISFLPQQYSYYKFSNYIYIFINTNQQIPYNSYENIHKLTQQNVTNKLNQYLSELYQELLNYKF